MKIFWVALLLCLYGNAEAANPVSLRGSPASQKRQNQKADEADLTRIKDSEQLNRFKRLGLLVPIRETQGLVIDPRLPVEFRFVRPWTQAFLEDLSTRFYKKFSKNLQVNSAVRTVEYQNNLRKRNKNAASTHGNRKSSHLTGATIDIAKLGMTTEELGWMRTQLLAFEKVGRIEAIEEHHQSVFHIMVFKVAKVKSKK